MSAPTFDNRYRLLKCSAEGGGVRSHHAQELATGRLVMVHLADDAGPETVAQLQNRLSRLPAAEKARVLETATLPAGFAVVTTFLPGLSTFPDWLVERVEPSPPALGGASPAEAPTVEIPVADPRSLDRPAAASPTPDAPDDGAPVPPFDGPPLAMEFCVGGPPAHREAGAQPPGEFTRLFMGAGRVHADRPDGAEEVPPLPALFAPPPAAPDPPPAAPMPSLPPGEFTRMFHPAAPSSAAGAGSSPLMPPGAMAPTPPSTPSFVDRVIPAAAPLDAALPLSPPVGSATGALRVRPASPPPPADARVAFDAPPAPVPAPDVPTEAGGARPPTPGELPSFAAATPSAAGFGSPFAAAPLAMPPLGPPPNGAPAGSPFGGPFGGASAGPVNPSPVPFAPAHGFTPTGAGAGPSEYTRLIRQTATPPVPTSGPGPAPTVVPPTPKPPLPFALVAMVNLVVLLALLLVLYFVFRPKAVPVVPAPPAAVPAAAPVPTAPAPNASAPAVPTAPATGAR